MHDLNNFFGKNSLTDEPAVPFHVFYEGRKHKVHKELQLKVNIKTFAVKLTEAGDIAIIQNEPFPEVNIVTSVAELTLWSTCETNEAASKPKLWPEIGREASQVKFQTEVNGAFRAHKELFSSIQLTETVDIAIIYSELHPEVNMVTSVAKFSKVAVVATIHNKLHPEVNLPRPVCSNETNEVDSQPKLQPEVVNKAS
ncbi:hypothetical protein HF521_000407 [Silurus meridionalis]|uniref:Uncharacterized protein n=1 Tax=Silurus meridionalis TaxID=175797 RepID=A0A8T0BZR4_SILME|nr:hypothetical protein HF521_000407 [Silurus meridionalis]